MKFDYSEAVGNMRWQFPNDRQVLHAWPNGICPTGYVLEPNMFELGKRRWDGCYKPGAWTPQLNATTGLMELRGTIDFLLHLEIMHTPVALSPVPKDRKAAATRASSRSSFPADYGHPPAVNLCGAVYTSLEFRLELV